MNQALIERFLEKKNIFAVMGASRDPKKYGYKVYRDLREANYTVYPVNPNAHDIMGDKCYGSLEELPEKPDVVDTVVPPHITERVVEERKGLGIKKVWMQPGSESEKAISMCKESGIDVIHGACVMVERSRRAETG